MPYYDSYYFRYYWIKQIDFEHSQHLSFFQHDLSKERLQYWLDDRKNMFDSIMEYAKAKKSGHHYLNILFYELIKPLDNLYFKPFFRLIQFHIKRLEREQR